MAVRWSADALVADVRRAVFRGIVRGTEQVRADAVRSIMSGGRSGRVYIRRGVTHQASAPGEPPASDTGRLANSIRTEYDATRLVGRVVVDAVHGPFLEYGTQTLAPRPFLRPALARQRGAIQNAVNEEVAKVLP
jgi:HK97 gp10 family phage protein